MNGHRQTGPACPFCATNGSEAAGNHQYYAERYRSVTAERSLGLPPWRVQVLWGFAGNKETVRTERDTEAAP